MGNRHPDAPFRHRDEHRPLGTESAEHQSANPLGDYRRRRSTLERSGKVFSRTFRRGRDRKNRSHAPRAFVPSPGLKTGEIATKRHKRLKKEFCEFCAFLWPFPLLYRFSIVTGGMESDSV